MMKLLKLYGSAALLSMAPFAFVHPLRVAGRSMDPALKDGELRIVLRAWCAGRPQRGQVWLLRGPGGEAVKRVVGLPGERLEQKEGELWLGGRHLEEPYVGLLDRSPGGPWDCGSGYLVAGDNRPLSEDGRDWGPLPLDAFEGRVIGADQAAR